MWSANTAVSWGYVVWADLQRQTHHSSLADVGVDCFFFAFALFGCCQAIDDEELRYQRLVELNVQEQCLNLYRNPVVQRQQAKSELPRRSEEHTTELQPLMRTSYAVFCLTKKTN